MKQVLKIWGLAAALLSLAASCSKGQDATTSEPSTPTETSGEAAPVTARISMETTLPEHDLRLSDYIPMALTSKGYAVDIEQLKNKYGGKIPISCIIRSDDPTQPVTYTDILFTLEERNTLRIGGKPVTLASGTDFTNAGGRKWYIMGWLGAGWFSSSTGELYSGHRAHNYGAGHTPGMPPATPNGELGMTAMMFPWKEIELSNEGGITLGNARKVDMKVRGAFIKVTLINKTGSAFSFSASDSYILSNAYSTQGSYNVNVMPSVGVFPTWTIDGTPNSDGLYRDNFIFTNLGRNIIMYPGEQYQNFVWVMPMPSPPANPQTKIHIAGQFGLTFVTNKPVRTTMLQEGKVYSLNIDVYRPMMGLDYMAEYDLLNGSETTPGTFATTHYNRQPGSLHSGGIAFNNVDILCPTGWHTPWRWEWDNAVVNQNSRTTEKLRLSSSDYTLPISIKATSDARYYLRYAGDPMNYGAVSTNNLRQAQRTRVIDNPDGGTLGTGEKMLEITSRYLGSSFTGTVDDLANKSEDWWSDPNYTVRRVLSAGHGFTTESPTPTSGHYYSRESVPTGDIWYFWEIHEQGGHTTNAFYAQGTYIRPFKDR